MYDVIIIGAGPAGLTAGIYTSRARLKTLLLESYNTPGQAVITSDIENYPGFPDGLDGFTLIDKFRKQAEKFGAEFKVRHARQIKEYKEGNRRAWQAVLENKEIINSLSIIIATGALPKKLGIPGEDEFCGKGVSYCATCDGALFKDRNIAVVGGGNTAVEEALFLTKFANKVTIIHKRNRLRAVEILQERASENKKIDFIWDSIVNEISGNGKVKALKIKNVKTEKESEFLCDGIFIFVGYLPNTAFLKGLVNLDEDGYVTTDEDMKTSEKGIFAAGDVRKKLLRQIVTACGDGAVAAVSAKKYVDELKGTAY